jgi:phosphinothricin acetyltransferase
MTPADGPRVLEIYRQGIATGNATFETDVPDWPSFDKSHHPFGRFVAESDGRVVGWSALTPSSQRCAYAGVAEVSVYVAPEAQGQGVGRALLEALLPASEEAGLWTLTAGILRENEASLRLHQKVGFRLIGFNERVGQLDGVWRDVIRMERRSPNVGY